MENTEYRMIPHTNDLDFVQDAQTENDNVSVVDYKMVTFSLAGKDYAIDIMQVKEIAKTGRFTYVPNTLPFVLGVYNLRGEIIPIIDLRLFFNIDVPERKDDSVENMLIVNVGGQLFGVVVDAIDKVVGIQKSTIQPPHPLFGDINIKYIYGVVECQNHLYILLDIERIFTSKSSSKENEKRIENTYVEQNSVHVEQSSSIPNIQPVQQSQPEKIAEPQPVKIVSPQAPVLQNEKVLETPAAPKVEEVVPQKEVLQVQSEPGAAQNVSPVENSTQEKLENNNQDYKFVVEELANLKKFYVSNVNEDWVKTRFDQWKEEKKSSTTQLQTEKDATDFLMPFWSPCNETWWTKEYADEIIKLLPENNAKQIVVWNPGCAKGLETYSLACVLKKHYPDSKIRIYAQDIDLLNISNAPLLSIPDQYATDWYAPYVTKKVSGEYTFTQEIKDIIMFEYHDCANSNSLPMIDIIFARDVLSLLPEESQDIVINDFDEKLKGNGIVIVGSHESLAKGSNWGEKTVGSLTYFNKL